MGNSLDFRAPKWHWVGATVATVVSGLALWGLLEGPFTALRLVLAIVIAVAFWTDVITFLPRFIFLPGVVLAAVGMATGNGNSIILFVAVVACGEAATTAGWLDGSLTLVTAVAAITVKASLGGYDVVSLVSWPLGCAFAAGCGAAVHTLLELNMRLQASQGAMAAQAVLDERRRVAREVHDVIAHSMTVTMLHISGARLSLQDEPPDVSEALDALAEAERQGRQSLADIRRTVGLLDQVDGSSPVAAPAPGAIDIPQLVETYREAGVEVSARIQGDVGTLSPTVGLAAYRIVQESVANAAKHAPGSPVHVDVHVGRRQVEVRVINERGRVPGRVASLPGGGRGTPGMAERARLLGGKLEAGPRGDDWRVTARLPLCSAEIP